MHSVNESSDLHSQFIKSRGQGHVHELSLCVHLKTSLDSGVNSVLQLEVFTSIVGVCLQSRKDLSLFTAGERLSGDDGDLLLLVELLVQLDVAGCNSTDVSESLVLSQHFKELNGQRMELAEGVEGLVEQLDLSGSDTCVLSEELERFRVVVQGLNVANVFVNCVQGLVFRSRREEHGGVSSLNGVLLTGRLVAWSALDLLHISN